MKVCEFRYYLRAGIRWFVWKVSLGRLGAVRAGTVDRIGVKSVNLVFHAILELESSI